MIVGEYPKIAEEIDTVHVRSFYSRQIFEFLFFQHDSIYWRAVCRSARYEFLCAKIWYGGPFRVRIVAKSVC